MNLTKFSISALALAVLVLTGCKNSDPGEHHFDNKLFINAENPVDELLFKESSMSTEESRTLTIRTPIPATQKITAVFKAMPSLVGRYNEAYYANALELPAEMYEIPSSNVTIETGAVESAPVTIVFKNTNTLDRETLYVLPVELTQIEGLDALPSKTTMFYVFRGAALVNVVSNISQNYFLVDWNTPDLVKNITTITVEALIRVSDFGTCEGKKGEAMSTIFGCESGLLFRIGDAAWPQNQIQLYDGSKFPTGNSQLGLPTNEWVHIAIVWDSTTGDRKVYHDGVLMASDTGARGSKSILYECYIGYAYNDQRWLNGDISELRIWSVQRTQEEIAANPYQVDPNSAGLIAYWKFDEGSGTVVKDHSPNGNDVTAAEDLIWTKVSLPEKEKE